MAYFFIQRQGKADAIVLAMGCREMARGVFQIGGTRPAGILSAGATQRVINIDGYLPGKKTVILGSGDLALIVARRITLEGGSVALVCEPKEFPVGNEANVRDCIEAFNIPIHYSTTVTRILGKERVSGVEIAQVDKKGKAIKGTQKIVKCDSFVYLCGLVPENEIIKEAGIRLDARTKGAYVNQYFETNVKGIFTCGNAVRIHDLVDFIIEEAQIVGSSVKKYLDDKALKPKRTVKIKNGEKILYSVPQHLDFYTDSIEGSIVYFRVNGEYKNLTVYLKRDGKVIYSRDKGKMSWLETGKIIIDSDIMEKIGDSGEITICAVEKKDGNNTDNNGKN